MLCKCQYSSSSYGVLCDFFFSNFVSPFFSGYSTTGDSLREVMYAESFEIDIQKLLEGRREREREIA